MNVNFSFMDLSLMVLSREENEAFYKFAVGDKFSSSPLTSQQFMNIWNEKHGRNYMISPDNLVSEDLKSMIAYWKDSLKRNHKKYPKL